MSGEALDPDLSAARDLIVRYWCGDAPEGSGRIADINADVARLPAHEQAALAAAIGESFPLTIPPPPHPERGEGMSAGRVVRAVEFAYRCHRGQMYGNEPYIVHPLAVASLCAGSGGTEDQIVAALLHDTIEDTAATVGQVRANFGDAVAALVASLTHGDETYAEYVANLTDDAVLVKLCDSRCNLAALSTTTMRPARVERLTARYERNIADLTARLDARQVAAS